MNGNRRWVMLLAPLALLAAPAFAEDGEAPDVFYVGDGEAQNVFYFGDETTAYLGVQLEEETDHEEGGARITQVVEDSPAEEAGLEEGDIIVSFDGSTVRGPLALTKKIHEKQPGDGVSIGVLRGGRKMRIDVELGDRTNLWKPRVYGQFLAPEINEQIQEQLEKSRELLEHQNFRFEGLGDRFRLFGDCEEGDCDYRHLNVWFGKPRLGVQLVEATPELRRHLGGSDDAGVLVSKVLPGTPAEAAGVRVGDLIVSVGGETVAGTGDLRRALADKTGESFDVEVIRDGRATRLEVSIPDPDDDVPTGPRAGLHMPLPVPPSPPLPAPAPLAAPFLSPRPVLPAPPAPPRAPRSEV